jgi:hypothetical protein
MMEEKLLDARIRVLLITAVTLSACFIAIVLALIAGLFTPNELIDNEKVFALLSYIVTAIAGALAGALATMMGFKAEKVDAPDMSSSVDAPVNVSVVNDLDGETVEAAPVEVVENTPVEPDGDNEDDDDDLAPWEKYRNDLRYDANGDGVVDELDFPDWRKNL